MPSQRAQVAELNRSLSHGITTHTDSSGPCNLPEKPTQVLKSCVLLPVRSRGQDLRFRGLSLQCGRPAFGC